MGIIGGADGPTSILISDKSGGSGFNTFGLVIMILLMIPNIIFAIKFRKKENKRTNKAMNIMEQIGRYGSMFLMIFNIGILDYGCVSVTGYIIYLIGSVILIVVYWIAWILFFIKPGRLVIRMALAIIPTILFLLSGFMLRQYLLVITAVIFGIGHIYVTYQNAKELI